MLNFGSWLHFFSICCFVWRALLLIYDWVYDCKISFHELSFLDGFTQRLYINGRAPSFVYSRIKTSERCPWYFFGQCAKNGSYVDLVGLRYKTLEFCDLVLVPCLGRVWECVSWEKIWKASFIIFDFFMHRYVIENGAGVKPLRNCSY